MNDQRDASFSQRVESCATLLSQQGVDALASLFDLVAPRAMRFALALTRNHHDAEDSLQAALVKVALNPRVLAQARHPWAYLLRIVRNEALKITSRRQANRFVELAEQAWSTTEYQDADTGQFIRQAINKLPASQSEVVLLKIWEGMTFAEIGEVLAESPNTAASRYRYAIEKLTTFLAPLSAEPAHATRHALR